MLHKKRKAVFYDGVLGNNRGVSKAEERSCSVVYRQAKQQQGVQTVAGGVLFCSGPSGICSLSEVAYHLTWLNFVSVKKMYESR